MTTDLLQDSLVHPFKSRVERREIRVGIIGLGYVGLPLALLYIDQRIPVTGFDIDQQKVDTLMTAGTYIFRIPEVQGYVDQRFRESAMKRKVMQIATMEGEPSEKIPSDCIMLRGWEEGCCLAQRRPRWPSSGAPQRNPAR